MAYIVNLLCAALTALLLVEPVELRLPCQGD